DWRKEFRAGRQMFLVGSSIVFAGLTARLAELQIFRAAEFDTKAQENRIRLDPAPAHRGTIYDRTGKILAGSKRNFYVTLTPEMIRDRKPAEVLDDLSRVISLSDSKKRSILQDVQNQPGFIPILVSAH